ncbi:OV-16 antigen, partial [Aphelenchoides avenae]
YNRTASAFIRYKIVPDIIASPPERQLYARFPSGGQVRLGNSLSPEKLQDRPSITWEVAEYTFYTFMMVDPDAPSPNDPSLRSWVNWLVVNIPGDSIAQGEVILPYDGPTPALGTGLHRYVLLAYEQPALIDPPFIGSEGFNVQDFVNTNKLVHPPLAGNFFRAQNDGTV